MARDKDRYDVVIIGAGISGLVCGCYLSEAGMKVLIVEKNDTVGGYCSSIEKNGYKFNLTTCMVGGVREASTLDKVFYKELQLRDSLFFKREKYSNTIITEDGIFNFDSKGEEVFSNLRKIFPGESRGLRLFLNLTLSAKNIDLYLKYKNVTFGKLLDAFFSCNKIKDFFAIPCGNFGFSPYKISAFSALLYYRETILNAGYHISGGAEKLPESMLDKIRINNGDILLSTCVDRIKVSKDGSVDGVELDNGTSIKTNYLVACCDIRNVLLNMIDRKKIHNKFIHLIKKMLVSSSAFIVYLGLAKPLTKEIEMYKSRTLWFCPKYDTKEVFRNIEKNKFNRNLTYLTGYLSSSGGRSQIDQVTLYTLVPFLNKKFWQRNMSRISHEIICKTEKIIKNISMHTKVSHIITPYDLYSYSLNSGGAVKGWVSIPQYNNSNKIPQGKIFANFYTAGQWSTLESGQGGIAMASLSGRRAARMILRNNRGIK